MRKLCKACHQIKSRSAQECVNAANPVTKKTSYWVVSVESVLEICMLLRFQCDQFLVTKMVFSRDYTKGLFTSLVLSLHCCLCICSGYDLGYKSFFQNDP